MVLGVLALAGAVIIPFFRHAVGMSAYEYFEHRLGTARGLQSLAFTADTFQRWVLSFSPSPPPSPA